jgi:hypothetical protein
MIRVTRQIKCLIAQAPGRGGVIPHPIPEVNFLMVEILALKPYIFMIRVNRQIKCPKSCGAGSSPSSTRSGQSLVKIDKMVSEICVILKKTSGRGWG